MFFYHPFSEILGKSKIPTNKNKWHKVLVHDGTIALLFFVLRFEE